MRKKTTLSLLIFFTFITGFSQDLDKFSVSTRQNVTWVLSEYAGIYHTDVNNAIDVSKWRMSSKMDNTGIYNQTLKGSGNTLENLTNQKVANAVFLNLLVKDGQITYDIIKEKVKNNMSDSDAIAFSATSVGVEGSAERKFFTTILQSNYIAVATIENLITQENKYDAIDRRNYNRAKREANDSSIKNKYRYNPIARTHTGYFASLYVTLYKIALDSEESMHNFEEAIFGGETEKSNQQMMDALIDYPFKLKKVNSGVYNAKALELISTASNKGYDRSHYFRKLFYSGNFTAALNTVSEDVDAFKTRAPIYAVEPNIQVKIGTKEALKINKRFYVYERVQGKNGKIKAKKRGTIRVKGKPSNNQGIAKGSTLPSNFYQISGKRLDKGMLVEEHPNSMSFGIGYTIMGDKKLSFNADMMLPITSTKLYVDLGFENNILTSPNSYPGYFFPEQKLSTVMYSGGIIKDLHFGRRYFLGLSLGLAMETTKSEDDDFNQSFDLRLESDDENYEDLGVSKITYKAGASFGVYLGAGMHLQGNLNYAPIKYKDASELALGDFYNKYTRTPLAVSISMHFSLGGI